MNGAGFIKDMITVTRQNRSLLKSEGSPYTNFDKSYITNSIVNRGKKVSKNLFKKASPAYYIQLKNRIREENRIVKIKKILLLVTIIAAAGISGWYYLFG